MRPEDIKLDEMVSFSEGLVSLHGRRLILHDIHAMAQLRKDLVDALGVTQSRRILSRFGYFWGEADAAAIRRVFNWNDLEQWLKAGPRMQELHGAARVELKKLEIGEEGRLHMEIVWHNSAEAEEQLLELGPSSDAGCWILQGYVSGYSTFCLGKPVYFTEPVCRGRGESICRTVGKDATSWGDRAEEFARNFEVDDIQGKIEDLTTSLRKKTLELARERKRLRRARPFDIVGMHESRSRRFQQVLDLARRVAPFDSSVLITGESGVGKEVIARFIHKNSPRRHRPFVAIDCGALPESLLESELFGHKAGSFTGAIRDRPGLFEQAPGGTTLLDEIGEVAPALQVKLLRVLQDKTIRRVGENHTRDIDCRIIAATNRDLREEIRTNRFREDLFYRLRVIEIQIPSLRERPEDILPLARFLTERLIDRLKLSRLVIHPTSVRVLEGHGWPGNVRELENALERAAILSDDGWIRPEHLPLGEERPGTHVLTEAIGARRSLAALERGYALEVLQSVAGNRSQAARILGISTTTLWRKLKSWGEEPPPKE